MITLTIPLTLTLTSQGYPKSNPAPNTNVPKPLGPMFPKAYEEGHLTTAAKKLPGTAIFAVGLGSGLRS